MHLVDVDLGRTAGHGHCLAGVAFALALQLVLRIEEQDLRSLAGPLDFHGDVGALGEGDAVKGAVRAVRALGDEPHGRSAVRVLEDDGGSAVAKNADVDTAGVAPHDRFVS